MSRTHRHTSPTPAIRAYLGGSFNPVHQGHIMMATLVYERLAQWARAHDVTADIHVALMPNARSPFKDTVTAPAHRLAMLQLAIKDTPLEVCELEIWQTPPVYSIDSVQTLRARHPQDVLIFVMGMDSAASLDKWKNGLELTDYVHLWVFDRQDVQDNLSEYDFNQSLDQSLEHSLLDNKPATPQLSALPAKLPAALQSRITFCLSELLLQNNVANQDDTPLKTVTHGRIYMDNRRVPAISSTQIRRHIHKIHKQPDPTQLSLDDNQHHAALPIIPQVYHYIHTHHLYSNAQLL